MRSLTFWVVIFFVLGCSAEVDEKKAAIGDIGPETDSLHNETGLRIDPNIQVVIANCTACHSAKMVTQNRATREGWKSLIVWMQQNQKLWDLGPNEEIILDYLAKYYSPQERAGRRQNLTDIEWYELE